MTNKTKIIIIIPIVIIIITITLVVIIARGIDLNKNLNTHKSADINTNINQNANLANSNENTNEPSSIVVNKEMTVTGIVFIKGYNTPSESYGVSLTDGNEIGLGKYDSMKEQFRPYIGDKIKVTFERVCKSTSSDCCLSLFFYCGTVKSWEPITKP